MKFVLAASYQATRSKQNRRAQRVMGALTYAVILLVPLILAALLWRAWPILVSRPILELLFSTTWRPLQNVFGFFPFIMGTLWVTVVAMFFSVPLSLLTAIYLSEYAKESVRSSVRTFIDLLAGIPSVVYGIWGILIIVPFVGNIAAPGVDRYLGFLPLFRNNNPTGFGVLAGGVVLAIMVIPVIASVSEEVIRAVPQGLREASLSLGATRWQMVRGVVLRKSWPGIIAAIMLGFSRAFGETMAVLMVVGNVPKIPTSIFDAAYPLPALIANNYGEMMSIPYYDSALLAGALILFLIVLGFNVISRLVLTKLVKYD